MKIALASDHAAVPLKQELLSHLHSKDNVTAQAPPISDEGEYPDHAKELCAKITSGEYDLGILLCGTGVGMSISANKIKGIRAVVCSDPYTAALSRAHNNANVLCIGARVVGSELAKVIVDAFVNTSFEGGRHARRVDKIIELES